MVGRFPVVKKKAVKKEVVKKEMLGMEAEESQALLERIYREATVPEYQFRLRWSKNTLAMWDNRIAQHYASSDYWPQRRVMERAAIIGERPV